jgi:DNA repair protein RadA
MEDTAEGVVRRVRTYPFHSSGSRALDDLLGGGFRAGRVTEVFGRSNSGKTQLAMQTALVAARVGTRTLFIDTEGSFRPERMEEIADARGWQVGGLLESVVYIRSDSSSEQMEAVRRMGDRAATSACGLVVIDTLTRNFSVELPGRSNLSSRQAALNIHLSEMARDAYLNKRAYLLMNRVTFGPEQDVGIGGKTVEQLVHAALRLERNEGKVRATLTPEGRFAYVEIGKAGIT